MFSLRSKGHSPLPSRDAALLSTRLDRNLIAYMAAAGAAGVALLSLAPPAEAKVIYTQTNIDISGGVAIDLNNDGTPELGFFRGGGGSNESFLYAYPLAAGAKMFGASQTPPLFFGIPIGRGEQFFSHTDDMAHFSHYGSFVGSGGPWAGKINRYLGVTFLMNGQPHFGWIRLTVASQDARITGYAYENIPNQNIRAGYVSGPAEDQHPAKSHEATDLPAPVRIPATLGALARGADALALWRRDEEESAAR